MCPCLVAILKLKMSALNTLFCWHAKIHFVALTVTKLSWARGRPTTVLFNAKHSVWVGCAAALISCLFTHFGAIWATQEGPNGPLSCHSGIRRGPKQKHLLLEAVLALSALEAKLRHPKKKSQTKEVCAMNTWLAAYTPLSIVCCWRLPLHCRLLWRLPSFDYCRNMGPPLTSSSIS